MRYHFRTPKLMIFWFIFTYFLKAIFNYFLFYNIWLNLILLKIFWSIIALQCCVAFCCIIKWISYMYTCIFSLLEHHPYTHPHQVTTEHWAELPVLYSRFPLAYFIHGSVLMGEGMAPHSSTLAWKIHGRRSLVGCSPWGR